jgi:hypothetical protein
MKGNLIRKRESGQSIVEFTLVLPFLLLLILGMVEIGMAFYNYIIIASANREGARLAARGRFSDEDIFARVISSAPVDYLETMGDEANFGIIITHYPIDVEGNLSSDITRVVSGTVYLDGEPVVLSPFNVQDVSRREPGSEDFHGDITARLNEERRALNFVEQENEIVVVETFYAHDPLFPPFLDLLRQPTPTPLYFSTMMRVMHDARTE